MSNAGDMNKKLTELAQLEKALWGAFVGLGKEYTPKIGLISAYKISRELYRERLLNKRYNYPFAAVIVIASGLATIFTSQYLWLIPYILSIWWMMKSWEHYVGAFAVKKLGTQTYIKFGFGITNLSLTAVGIIKLLDVGGGRLTKESVTSITKIVKASHDHGDVSFGLSDAMKKAIYATPLPLLYSTFEHIDTVKKYSDSAIAAISKEPLILAFLVTGLLPFVILGYDLLFGQTLQKQRKKKYLLLLTVIGESFVR